MPKSKGHRFSVAEDSLAKRISRFYKSKGYNMQTAKNYGYATVNKLKARGIKIRRKVKVSGKIVKI